MANLQVESSEISRETKKQKEMRLPPTLLNKKPIVLVILDGWGITEKKSGNAIAMAKTPTMNKLFKMCPHTTLKASGEDVGLPKGVIGSSEVGHLNIGAGRIVLQDLPRINKAIETSNFSRNRTLLTAFESAKKNAVHLAGLLSDGGVHSHIEHLFALLEMGEKQKINKLYVHAFLDGRDAPPKSALKYARALESKINQLGVGKVATVMGRYYSMDRDNRWDRTAKAYYAMVLGKGRKAKSITDAIEKAYSLGETDEFVLPTIIVDEEGKPVGPINNGDSLIFFNFRSDRLRQLVMSFISKDFEFFDRVKTPKVRLISMTEYDKNFRIPVAFSPEKIVNCLGEVLSRAGINQLRIAESEKFPHVTYFFNGGREKPFPGEDRIVIPSPKVPTYDLKPSMNAYAVTRIAIDKIKSANYGFILINYANPDMVAHTGKLSATIRAIEVVDKCLKRLIKAVEQVGGLTIVTSDHGHAEEMVDSKTGKTRTAHTCNPVPFILVSENVIRLRRGRLADIAPTILHIMNTEKPHEMTGTTLIQNG